MKCVRVSYISAVITLKEKVLVCKFAGSLHQQVYN
jgi:hypothetical protein